MNRQPYEKPPRWWGPKMSPVWIRFWRPFRRRNQLTKHRLLEVEVRGLEHVRDAIDRGQGVLITPNHASHADCHCLYAAADELRCPVYVMIAWQIFARDGWLRAMLLRHHGGFSIDREGTDLHAIRQAKEILQSCTEPACHLSRGRRLSLQRPDHALSRRAGGHCPDGRQESRPARRVYPLCDEVHATSRTRLPSCSN